MKVKLFINAVVVFGMIAIGTQGYPYNQATAPNPAPIPPHIQTPALFHWDASALEAFKQMSYELHPIVTNGAVVDVIRPKARPKWLHTTIKLSQQDLKCVAINIYHEARNQNDEGQQAIAWVVFNRMINSNYPSTACHVVFQARTQHGKVVKNQCQFSWYCDGVKDKITDTKAWRRALVNAKVAELKFNRAHKILDPTHGAIMYHTVDSSPNWVEAYHPTAVIGDHIFYKG